MFQTVGRYLSLIHIFCVAVFGSILFRKFLAVIPILIAIIAGYVAACIAGIVDFQTVADASFFSLPHFQLAKFNMEAIVTMLPVLLVIASEHIGHQIVTSKVVEMCIRDRCIPSICCFCFSCAGS